MRSRSTQNGVVHSWFRLVPAGAQAKLFDLETLPAPMQAEERAAGGNKTAFQLPASPSLSRQGRNSTWTKPGSRRTFRGVRVVTHFPRPRRKCARERHEGAAGR